MRREILPATGALIHICIMHHTIMFENVKHFTQITVVLKTAFFKCYIQYYSIIDAYFFI